MEILGIGPLELLFFLLIALILFGPNDMVKAGHTIGRFLRRVVTSEEWQAFNAGLRQLRYLPNTLMREAGLEGEELEALRQTTQALQAPLQASKGLMDDARRELTALDAGISSAASRPAAASGSAAGYGTWAGHTPRPAPAPQPSTEPPAPAGEGEAE